MQRRLGVLLTAVVLVLSGLSAPPAASAATRPLPSYLSLPAQVRQLVTVTSYGWSNTRATMTAWRRDSSGWHRAHGPVRVRLGWNGWAPAGRRRQNSGTTPAGKFTMPSAFGNRADPGAKLRYTRADGNDVWPYEPRDPATYNIYQPYRASTSHWRRGYSERIASYGSEYAHAVVLGYNLPRGVH